MRLFTRIRLLFRSLLHPGQLEADLDEELRGHLEQEIEDNMRRGMSREEAMFAARRLTGSLALYEDECRDSRPLAFFETALRDGTYAIRNLRRTPLFTAAAILSLALGIGANTTIFTFIENVVLRSLPIPDPQHVVSVNWGGSQNISYPNYADLRDRNAVFSDLAACRFNLVNLSLRSRVNELVWGYEASGNYFQMLGLQPLLGRFFTPAEDNVPGAHPVVVLSYKYWKSRFGSDRSAIGKSVKLNGYAFNIIGVTPPSFVGTELIMTPTFGFR